MSTMTTKPTRSHQPLGTLRRLHIATLVATALALVYLQGVVLHLLVIPLVVMAVLTLGVAGLVARGWRWALLLGAVWIAVVAASNASQIAFHLTHPQQTHEFSFNIVFLGIGVIGIAAAIGAWRQGAAPRGAPGWLAPLVASIACVAVGAIGTALLVPPQTNAGLNEAALAQLPAVQTANFAFAPGELRARVGETVALRLENDDSTAHSFDIDALGVHVTMPTGAASLALFKPTAAGTYQFYCSIPGHEAMHGTLVVAP